MPTYERALARLIDDDPGDRSRFKRLVNDTPAEKIERATAGILALKYLLILDHIQGRDWRDHSDTLIAEVHRRKDLIVAGWHALDRRDELTAMRYADYLRTPEWKARRVRALEAASHRCSVCNTGSNLDVHHRTYERRGAEVESDLTVLCRSCHGLFHEHRDLVG